MIWSLSLRWLMCFEVAAHQKTHLIGLKQTPTLLYRLLTLKNDFKNVPYFWEHIEADCVHYVRGYIDAVYGVTSPNGKRSERDHGRNRVPSQGS